MRSSVGTPAPHAVGLALTCVIVALLASSATAEVFRGDFDRPPFYHGKPPAADDRVAHVSVSFRDDPASLDLTPDRSPALAALLDSLRVELDRIALTLPLPEGDWPMRDGPRIRFGCRRGGTGPDGLPRPADEIDPDPPRRMTFGVEEPGRAWRERVTAGAGDSIDAVIAIQLGFEEQWVRQASWKGRKAIEIGTDRSMPVPWLTSLDTPVQVLQLTGAVLTPTGRVMRVGAEGLMARRTRFGASVLGAQETLTEKDLAALVAPAEGGPEPWRSALRTLVTNLVDGRARR